MKKLSMIAGMLILGCSVQSYASGFETEPGVGGPRFSYASGNMMFGDHDAVNPFGDPTGNSYCGSSKSVRGNYPYSGYTLKNDLSRASNILEYNLLGGAPTEFCRSFKEWPTFTNLASLATNRITLLIIVLTAWYFDLIQLPESKEKQEKMKMLEARIQALESLQAQEEFAAEQAAESIQAA